jgi:hypothetical protein
MKTPTTTARNRFPLFTCASLLTIASLTTSVARADFTTGFESSSGYTSGNTVVGVQDTSAPSGSTWVNGFGGSLIAPTVSSSNPAGGSGLHLRIDDTSAAANHNSDARLNLTTAVDLTKAFNFSFSFAVAAGQSGGTFGIILGDIGYQLDGTGNNWFAFGINNNQGFVYMRSGGTVSQVQVSSNLTSFSDPGNYINVSVDIDPTTRSISSFFISGTKKTTDILATNSNFTGKQVPWQGDADNLPDAFLNIGSSTANIGTLDIDNISLSNIPEPSTAAALLGIGALSCVLCSRRRTGQR